MDIQKLYAKAVLRYTEPKTNADRIRAMSDEELANTLHFMFVAYDFRDPLDILDWLKSPVEEGDNG